MSLYWPYVAADYVAFLELQTAIVAVIIFLSSIDDLFIDAWYWVRKIYRALYVLPKYAPLTAQQLHGREEQPIAIMVPAWLEYDVIAAMIENMIRVLDYRRYVIFVGTYVNDAATIAEVERIACRYRQLVRVEVPHAGPTCKADCLNWVVQAIFLHERQRAMEFAGVVLHDSEDVLHPLELKFFNYLLPRKDLIQIPVMSLEREWYELVAGVYMDEFAEWHAKDLVVRESVVGAVPSAGVGTCFSRRALLVLAAETGNQPFNTASLTEDYDIGARLALHGMQSIIAQFPVEFRVTRRSWFGYGPQRELTLTLPLCVREYFPDTFRASYRQKARWVLGIGLQSWSLIGWQGSLANRYLLMRDRKGMLTSVVTIFAYLVAFQLLVMYVLAQLGLWDTRYPGIFVTISWLPALLVANAVAFFLRIVQRFYFVNRLYGWENGLMSIPRLVVGNVVNFWAVCRAWKIFLSNLLFDTPIVWDKTMHDFPSQDALHSRRQRLGELLVSWQAIDQEQLDSILDRQKESHLPLGRYLVRHGLLDEEMLADALAHQADLARATVSAPLISANATLLPGDLCVRLRALPIGRTEAGQVVLAVGGPLAADDLAAVTAVLGHEPLQQIARESEVANGLRLIRGSIETFDQADQTAVPLLGDLLMEHGLVDPALFTSVMRDYRPSEHGRIGDFLVQRGVVTPQALQQAVAEQQGYVAHHDG
jgi:bacteriophage N4 adsorption protein B